MKYAEILPKLAGNPLYVWSHLELKSIFGITEPLSGENAERIYAAANEKLRLLNVRSLFEKFRVEFVATTDDPCDGLENCGRHCGALVTPTFRPDKLLFFNEEYLQKLAKLGIPATEDEMYTTVGATIDYLHAHYPKAHKLFLLGTPGMIGQFEQAGFVSTADDPDDVPDVVIASFVTIIQLLMQAYVPSLYETLGVFIPLIVVNCIILGRAEAFASKHNAFDSALDGLGIGLGFTLSLTLIGAVREMLGSGSVFGYKFITGDGMIAFVLAPGAFLVLGYLMALFNKLKTRMR